MNSLLDWLEDDVNVFYDAFRDYVNEPQGEDFWTRLGNEIEKNKEKNE